MKNDSCSAASRCFSGEGEIVDAMCAMDWSQTPLGQVRSWSTCTTTPRFPSSVQIATDMRGPQLDAEGLYATIAWHARDFERRTRIKTTLELSVGLPQPAPEAAGALLGIFQEAMTNVLRHAQAGQVWVSLDRCADALLLRVRDGGGGSRRLRRANTRSLGLTVMHERAALGGRMAVGPLKSRGSLVSALIPLHGGAAIDPPPLPQEEGKP